MPTTSKILAWAALIAILIVIGLTFCKRADAAEEWSGHDPQRSAWFKSLLRPDTGTSCCDISDCKATDAKQAADGTWTAVVNGRWRDIPPAKVLASPLSIDGNAYVCASPGNGAPEVIYCFLPAIPGF